MNLHSLADCIRFVMLRESFRNASSLESTK